MTEPACRKGGGSNFIPWIQPFSGDPPLPDFLFVTLAMVLFPISQFCLNHVKVQLGTMNCLLSLRFVVV